MKHDDEKKDENICVEVFFSVGYLWMDVVHMLTYCVRFMERVTSGKIILFHDTFEVLLGNTVTQPSAGKPGLNIGLAL